jgi:hypothetical protein
MPALSGGDTMERKKKRLAQEIGGDLQDVRLYLERRFPDQAPIHIRLLRHYGSRADEIAYLVVLIDRQEDRRRVRAAGEVALGHIGYLFAPHPGADVYDLAPSTDDRSAHETIRALRRFSDLPHENLPPALPRRP